MTSRAMSSSSAIRLVLIALISLLLLLLAALLINLMPLFSTSTPAHVPAQVHRGVVSTTSIPEAEIQARARATAWAGDARLVRVEGMWYLTADWREAESPPVAWTFYYFSPTEASVGAVAVAEDNVMWVPPIEIASQPAGIAAFPPAHGPDMAWVTFLAAGGEEFLTRHSQAQVSFRLQQDGKQSVWSVTALEGEDNHTVVADAQTGALIPSEPQTLSRKE